MGRGRPPGRGATPAGGAARGVDRAGRQGLEAEADGEAAGARGAVPARLGDDGRDLEGVEAVEAEPLPTVFRERDDPGPALPAAAGPVAPLGGATSLWRELGRASPTRGGV